MMSWLVASSLYFPVRDGPFIQRCCPSYGGRLNLRGNQRRGWRLMKICLQRLIQKVEHRATLLAAGRDDRPDAFAPALSRVTARPLRDAAVDGHEANRLLRQVVGR